MDNLAGSFKFKTKIRPSREYWASCDSCGQRFCAVMAPTASFISVMSHLSVSHAYQSPDCEATIMILPMARVTTKLHRKEPARG